MQCPGNIPEGNGHNLKVSMWNPAIPYLDDIIIYSDRIEEHAGDVRKVFEKLREAGILLNSSKCNFFKEEIKILGSVISKGIVRPDPEKIVVIKEYKFQRILRN